MRRLITKYSPWLAIFPLLKLNIFNIVFAVWLLFVFIVFFKDQSLKNKKWTPLFWTFPVLYFTLLVAYFPFADNFDTHTKIVVQSMYFLLIPLLMYLLPSFNEKQRTQSLSLFIITTTLENIRGWWAVFQTGIQEVFATNDFYHPTIRTAFIDTTDIHIPYLGMLSSFAALLCFLRLFRTKKWRLLNLINYLFIAISIYCYSARMALVTLLIGSVFILWKKIKKKQIQWLSLIAAPLLAFGLFWFSPIKERYQKSLEKEWVLPHAGQQPHEVNYRYAIFHCASQVIQDHFWTGVKPDQVQNSLNQCYDTFTYESYEDFQHVTYNSHNQYLDFILKFGIFGGIFLVGFLGYYFFKTSDLHLQVFLLVIGISLLTENLFDRQLGIVFFTLFFSILYLRKNN